MVGLSSRVNLRGRLPRTAGQAVWEVRRGIRVYLRRFGLLGMLLPGCAVLGIVAWTVDQQQIRALASTQLSLTEQELVSSSPVENRGVDGRGRLKAFDEYLLDHENIPVVVQDILNLAEDEKLSITRGEYRPQIDVQGKFLRYRMTLPVKGDAQAIRRFMLAALHAQKTLALESVQFKRERIESSKVEARIQWIVLTRLPSYTVGTEVSSDTTGGGAR